MTRCLRLKLSLLHLGMFNIGAAGPEGMVRMSKKSNDHVNVGHLVRGALVEGGVMGTVFMSVGRSLPAGSD